MGGNSSEQKTLDVRSAKTGWFSMGKFWYTPNFPRATVRLVFAARVQGALLSGFECFVPGKLDLDVFDTLLLHYARILLRGSACIKNKDKKYAALSNNAVWKKVKMVPSGLELQIRRLRWYQSVSFDPSTHAQYLTALFGRFRFEQEPTIIATGHLAVSANPWARQFVQDVGALRCLDGGCEFLIDWDERPLELFGES